MVRVKDWATVLRTRVSSLAPQAWEVRMETALVAALEAMVNIINTALAEPTDANASELTNLPRIMVSTML